MVNTKRLRFLVLCFLIYTIVVSCSQICPTRCANGVCTPQPCQVRVIVVNVGHK